MNSRIVHAGWFDDPSAEAPAYDPGVDGTPCPVCGDDLAGTAIKTINLMGVEANRSYFFYVHKHCWEATSEEGKTAIESQVIDARHQ